MLLKILLVWLFTATLQFLISNFDSLSRDYRVMSHPARATATVTAQNCSDHALLDYKFSVGNLTFSGADSLSSRCAQIAPGEQVEIFYDQERPEWNRRSEVDKNELELNLILGVFFSAFFGLAAALILEGSEFLRRGEA
jgi:hypothetical protein